MKKAMVCILLTGLLGAVSIGLCGELELRNENTRKLVSLVDEAGKLIEKKGEVALTEFQLEGSRWRHGKTYIYVLDMEGNCLVHPDMEFVGKNLINLRDANGKTLIRSIIAKVSSENRSGWVHYLWPKPGDLFPVWKSTYVKRVKEPSGQEYIVCCGLYNIRMERSFIVEVVNAAVDLIKSRGKSAFSAFRSKSGDFYFLNTYIFVFDAKGNNLVNPAFPNLEGRNMFDVRDRDGKYVIREMIGIVKNNGAGWTDYLWPRPGEAHAVKKSVFVKGVVLNKRLLIVGSGLYSD